MSEYIYCVSNPSVPGVIRLDKSLGDPRRAIHEGGARALQRRIDWVLRVADSDASLAAITQKMPDQTASSQHGYFQSEPMVARATAIKFTTVRTPEAADELKNSALPSLVIGLGLAIQFLEIMHGNNGPSPALIASALFWVVHTLPIGSKDR